jgi:hypothetical protein
MALISVTISGNAAPLKKSLDESESRLGKFGSSVGKIGTAAAVGFAAAGAATLAFAKSAIAGAEAAQVADQRLEAVNKSMNLFGASTAEVTTRLQKLADAQEFELGVTAESIKATQAKLLTFAELGKTADQVGGAFDRATTAAIDLAAAGFGNAESNAVQLGKALQDPIKGMTALSKSGVTFTEAEKERIATLVESNKLGEAQAMILGAIEKQVGGTAAATVTSSFKIGAAFGHIMDTVGEMLLPIMEKLADFIVKRLIPFFNDLAERYGPRLREAFQKIADIVRAVAIPVMDAFRSIFDKVREVVDRNSESIEKVRKFFGDFVSFVRDRVAPIVVNVLGGAFKFIIENIFPVLLDGLFKFIGALANVGSFVIKIADTILKAFEAIANGIIDAVNFVIRQINRVPGVDISEVGGVSFTMPSFGGTAPAAPSFVGSPDRLDIGGASFAGAIPELTIPEPSGGGRGGGGGGGGGRGGLSIDPRALATGGLTLPNLADYGTLESARLADLALMNAQPAVVQNITVNTVTADENFPTLLVDNLQRYNLIYGPAEIEIAI